MRFALLPATNWYGDTARDLLVPEHILRYHELPNIGHVASGTNPVSYYPPLYFYILAFLMIPSTHIWYILSIVVLINSLSIGVVYLLTKRLSNGVSALISAGLYACSSYMLLNQSSLTAYRFSVPILLFGSYVHLVGIQHKRRAYVYAGILLLIIASSINYAVAILIPMYLLWTIIFLRKHLDTVVYMLCFMYVLILGIFYGYAHHVISHYGIVSFLTPYLPNNNTTYADLLNSLSSQYRLFLSNVFTGDIRIYALGVPIFLIVSALKNRMKVFSLLYPLSFISVTIFLSAIKNKPVSPYFYYPVTPFLFILIGSSFSYKKSLLVQSLSSVCIAFFAWSAIQLSPGLFSQDHIFQQTKDSADSIVVELKNIQQQEHYPDMHFMQVQYIDAEGSRWQMTTYAYFLEHALGKLLEIDDHYHNLRWIGTADYLVVICIKDTSHSITWCHNRVKMMNPNAVLIKSIPDSAPGDIFLFRNSPQSEGRTKEL